MSIFRAYDIRGIVDKTLTVDIVEKIGQSIASEAQTRGVSHIVVGRDGRLSGLRLITALIKGLRAGGVDVTDIGQVPTPWVYFATYLCETGSGVMLTGSHNPPDYNGLKIMLGGDTLSGDAIARLKQRIDNNELSQGAGQLFQRDVSEDYYQRVCDDIQVQRKFKVVVDCGNGVAGDSAPELLRRLGCDVIELFCEVDGHFPNHHPDPTQPKNVQDLIQAVKTHNADVGLGFDGDGDRLGVVDGLGNIIWADRQMMLYAQDILSRHQGAKIVYDIKCTRHLDSEIRRHGGEPIMWKTGHSYMKAKLKETGALLAGEMSGHIFFKERWYGFDDALYTAARLLEILSNTEQSPVEVFAQLPESISTPELHVDMQVEGRNFAFMQQLIEQGQFADGKINHIDGLRVDFDDGWGLVRPSNTTPYLVLRFEAENETSLNRIKDLFKQQLLAIDADLILDF